MLKDEIARMWGIKKVIIIPFVLGTLGALSNGFEKYVAAIEIDIKKEPAQKTALLGTVSILKVILGCLKNKTKMVLLCKTQCKTFDNRLLFPLTELARATNNKCSQRMIKDNNNNNNNNNKKDNNNDNNNNNNNDNNNNDNNMFFSVQYSYLLN